LLTTTTATSLLLLAQGVDTPAWALALMLVGTAVSTLVNVILALTKRGGEKDDRLHKAMDQVRRAEAQTLGAKFDALVSEVRSLTAMLGRAVERFDEHRADIERRVIVLEQRVGGTRP